MQNKLKEDEKSILQQLNSLVEEKLKEGSHEMPREILFQPVLPELNLLGFVAQDGVLPGHLSLSLLSELEELRACATLRLEVVLGTQQGLSDSWQRRILLSVVAVEEDGSERKIPVQRKAQNGKVQLRFEAGLGVHRVSVRLYGQHIQSSPLLLPIQAEPEEILAKVGLCFLGQSQGQKPQDVKVESQPERRREDDDKSRPAETESFPAKTSEQPSKTSTASSSNEESQAQGEEVEDREDREIRARNFSPGQTVIVMREGVGLKAVLKDTDYPLGHFLVQFVEQGNFDIIPSAEISHVVEEPPLIPGVSAEEPPAMSLLNPEKNFQAKAAGDGAHAPSSFPRGPQCSLCLKDARKAKELICDGSTVCWGCAVKVDLQ